ncbi:reverse transcriptase domain-containing protein [Desulforamulus profundi]|uniref:reverse transcriptase domain-containing protein n=1 Tax=Desulforamulus profundi TaxID=1383067 RepID=UPI0030838A68
MPPKERRSGVVSPILANVYLHYALDLWFEKVVRRACRGDAYMVRYCDDFVCCFQYEDEAKAFYRTLVTRLGRFNLEIAEEKTKIIRSDETQLLSVKGRIGINRKRSTFSASPTIAAKAGMGGSESNARLVGKSTKQAFSGAKNGCVRTGARQSRN